MTLKLGLSQPRWEAAIMHFKNFKYCALGFFLVGLLHQNPLRLFSPTASSFLMGTSAVPKLLPASQLPVCPCHLPAATTSGACHTRILIAQHTEPKKVPLCCTFHLLWALVFPGSRWNQCNQYKWSCVYSLLSVGV